jgi:[acyl-carrier-protein] S-malonyltransferase
MRDAAAEFKEEAVKISFNQPKADFYSNVTMKKVDSFTNLAEFLGNHIISPVMFVPELQNIQKDGYDTFIEIGPGKVLSGLVSKTLDNVKTLSIDKEIPV